MILYRSDRRRRVPHMTTISNSSAILVNHQLGRQVLELVVEPLLVVLGRLAAELLLLAATRTEAEDIPRAIGLGDACIVLLLTLSSWAAWLLLLLRSWLDGGEVLRRIEEHVIRLWSDCHVLQLLLLIMMVIVFVLPCVVHLHI